jgi:hypothetical protein
MARCLLSAELKQRGAKVDFFDIPEDAGVNGIDDLMGLWGPERCFELIQRQAYDPEKSRSGSSSPEPARIVPGPQPLSMQELMALDVPAAEMLIEDLIPLAGAVLVVGTGNAGKTILSAQIGLAVAAAKPLFGFPDAQAWSCAFHRSSKSTRT